MHQSRKEIREFPAEAGTYNDELFDLKEASTCLKVKPETVYAWVHQRKIPYRKHGSRLVFSKGELLTWSDAQSVRPLELPGLNSAGSKGKNDIGLCSAPGAEKVSSLKIRRIVPSGLTSRKEEHD